jgi:uncharacterized protein (DUF2252 family)
MASFAAMGNLAVWYARTDVDELQQLLHTELDAGQGRRLASAVAKARTRDHLKSLDKLTELVDGRRRFVADPPLLVPVSDVAAGLGREDVERVVTDVLSRYAVTLPHGVRELIGTYTFVDMARKVVGVGSVGTRCWVVLMRGRDESDPLFLQVKEAQASVLAPHLGPSPHSSEGERVVVGQRMMQAAGDVFLGWHTTTGLDGTARDFYVRQLRDWKGSADIDRFEPKDMRLYGGQCASTLARAHARTGDRIAIAAYLGADDRIAEALADFAEAYADRNDRDHALFTEAVAAGTLVAGAGGAA